MTCNIHVHVHVPSSASFSLAALSSRVLKNLFERKNKIIYINHTQTPHLLMITCTS